MKQLQVFEQRNVLGQELKIYGTQGEPLFLAKDVADWIEHNKPSELAASVDEDEKLMAILSHSGQNRQMWFLTENGMYEVLMQSRKPIAKVFKKKVKEILKDVRQHGIHTTPQTMEAMLNDPDTMIELLKNYKEAKEKQIAAELKIENDRPKVLFADAVDASRSSILIGELAKLISQNGYDIGQNRLFEWLRDNGFLIKRKGESFNLPTQRSM